MKGRAQAEASQPRRLDSGDAARYRELFEAVGEAVLVLDAETRAIEDANPAALAQFGYGKGHLLALRAEALDMKPGEAYVALRRFARAGHWPTNAMRLLRRKDGTVFAAEITAGTFEHEGRIKVIAAIRDVTQRRRSARTDLARERAAMHRHFVATVSHELRTPIAAIRGFAETLLGGALDDAEARREFVTTIFRHSVRVTRLVDDLLTLSLLDSGKRQASFENIDARRFVHDFVCGMEPVAKRRRQRLRSRVCSKLVVRADASQLTQVLQNLVDNALKFSPPGSRVTIEADSPAGEAHFRVRDRGPGIPAEKTAAIFEPFERGTASRKVQGAGLGLTIARQIVLAHGGRIWVQSRTGQGTTFHFTLPCLAAGQQAAAAIAAD